MEARDLASSAQVRGRRNSGDAGARHASAAALPSTRGGEPHSPPRGVRPPDDASIYPGTGGGAGGPCGAGGGSGSGRSLGAVPSAISDADDDDDSGSGSPSVVSPRSSVSKTLVARARADSGHLVLSLPPPSSPAPDPCVRCGFSHAERGSPHDDRFMSFSPIGAFRMPPEAAGGAGVGAGAGRAGDGDDVDYAEDDVSALVFAGVDAVAARQRLRTRSSGGSSDFGSGMGGVMSPIASLARPALGGHGGSPGAGSFDGVTAQVDSQALGGRRASAFGRLSLASAPSLPVVAYGCVKPMNFAQVEPGLYRSGYPTPASFGYLERLGVKTIINLYAAVFPEDYKAWTRLRGVNLMRFCISGNKLTPYDMDSRQVRRAIVAVLDTRNHPVLVHCRSGKHRSGAIIGLLRRLQGWTSGRACREYLRHSCPKDRSIDMDFVRLFDLRPIKAEMQRLRDDGVLARWTGLDATLDGSACASDAQQYPQHAFDMRTSLQGGKPYRPLEKAARKAKKRQQRLAQEKAAREAAAAAAAAAGNLWDEGGDGDDAASVNVDDAMGVAIALAAGGPVDNGGDFLAQASENARLYGAARFDAELRPRKRETAPVRLQPASAAPQGSFATTSPSGSFARRRARSQS